MPRPGTKTITFPNDAHEQIKKIAERNDMNIYEAVIYAFQKTFPSDFPEKVIA